MLFDIRGFGDRPFKEPRPLVSAEPDVFRVALRPTEAKFIVLACDGIWNWLSNEQVGKFVNRQLNEGKNSRDVSKGLIKLAFAQGSTDNITAMIINLRHCESRSAAMTPSETVMKLADSDPIRRRRSSPSSSLATDPASATATAVSSRKTKSRYPESNSDNAQASTNEPSPTSSRRARKGAAKSEPTKRRSNQ
jgi:serine/threonine protein phosphatase PrpC